VDLELSFCHFGAFSFSTGEQKQMHRTYIKCAGHALLEYEKVLEDTTELVELINIFHPPYLLRMRIKDDVMRTAFKQFRRVFHGLSFNEVEEEFNLYHTEVKVDLTLPFGNAYWGRGAPSNSLFPNLAELAHRLLSIRPSVAATESTFSLMKLITGTQRQSLSMEARNAELYLRFNGPLSSLKAKRLTFTQNIEVYEP
jgi:alpha-N-acetylglucosamine transferase